MTRERQQRAFEEIWASNRRSLTVATKLRLQPVRRLLVGRILDVGAGDGQVIAFRADADVTSTDLTFAACRSVVSKGRPAVQADVGDLPFDAGSFDTVVMLEVIEHVVDPAKTLGEVRRVLKAGGTFVLSTPNAGLSFVERLAWLTRRGVWPTSANLHQWDPLHVRRLTVEEVSRYVEDAGFEVLGVWQWAKSGFALGCYFIDALGSRLGLPPTAGYFARLDALLPMDTAANTVLAARTRSTAPDLPARRDAVCAE